MKKTICLIIILLSNLLSAQIEVDSITYYHNKGDFKKAIRYGEKKISFYDENGLKKNEGFVNTVSWLATLYETNNDTIKKDKYYKLLEENISYCGENYKSKIQYHYLIAKNYKAKKEYALAEENFIKSINLSELKNFEEDVYFYSLLSLGEIYIDQEKSTSFSDKTKKILDKQLLISEKLFTKDSFDFAFALTNFGLYFTQKENYIKAEECFLKALSIIENLPIYNEENYLAILDNISKFYQTIHQLAKADLYNQKGLDIILKNKGKEHTQYLDFLSNKANIKTALGDFDSAFWVLYECFYLAKEKYGENSTYFGAIVSNMATVLYQKKEFKLAETYYLKDYDITKKRYGENNFQTAMCLNKLSNVYSSLKEDEKAIEYNLKALKIIENSIGKENCLFSYRYAICEY